MLGDHPSIEIPQASNYAKEMRRHEAHHSRFGPPGRPFVQMEYPKVLYKCAHVAGKGIQITDRFVVEDADQERNMNSRGFFVLAEAGRLAQKQQTEFGILAAERNWEIAHGRISEKAAAEVRAAEDAHGGTHMPMVPETPIQRRVKREDK
jgi:hypothetical protein